MLERLRTVALGEMWVGRDDVEVQVNQGLLSQLIAQGFQE